MIIAKETDRSNSQPTTRGLSSFIEKEKKGFSLKIQSKSKKKPRRGIKGRKKLSETLIDRKKKKIIDLFNKGELEKAASHIDSFEKSLENNPEILSRNLIYIAGNLSDRKLEMGLLERAAAFLYNYGNDSLNSGKYKEAIEIYEKALETCPRDSYLLPKILNGCGHALFELGSYKEAIGKFEQALEIDPDDSTFLNNYGAALRDDGQYESAITQFDKALKINPDDSIVLGNYALTFLMSYRFKEAIEMYEKALQINPDMYQFRYNYGVALTYVGRYNEAIEQYEKAIRLYPDYVYALGQCGFVLTLCGRFDEAFKKYDHLVKIAPETPFLPFLKATILERNGQYEEALTIMKKIIFVGVPQNMGNLLYLHLGRLYYLNKLETEGDKYFNLAIEHSDDKDASRIKAAQNIFAVNPYDNRGIEILEEISRDSLHYAEALKTLTINLPPKAYWQLFKNPSNAEATFRNTQMLNRSLYHKIENEVSILKGIAQRIIYKPGAEDETLTGIIESIEGITRGIKVRRGREKEKSKPIPLHKYEKLVEIISKTAHDISDFVNNELAVIESKVRRMMRNLSGDNQRLSLLNKLLEQLEFTQGALNDLKSVNEGIDIKYKRFQVKKLFEKWGKSGKIDNATISLDIRNASSYFNGDEEKIKSALNELVENSIKHNPGKIDLEIRIFSDDIVNPPWIKEDDIPSRQKYLFIEFSDNGKGIEKDMKEKIFLPLVTTDKDRGSGLGLFIIKRTLHTMKGYIVETGEKMARFEIYLPYIKGEASEEVERESQYSFIIGG
jgi:tetratricopeptide (TPR) repeat protein